MIGTLLMNFIYPPLAYILDFMVLLYFMLIFFHSWSVNKSLKVAFLSIISSFIQLTAYGLGFMQDLFKRVVFGGK